MNAQALARENPVVRTPTTPDNMGEHNFMKGEATGIRALMALPITVIESATSQLEEDDTNETPTAP
jgi:hypothetical protein